MAFVQRICSPQKVRNEEGIMNKIEINNFGPVKKAEIDLDKHNQVFIGPQASGKSTICKVIYFCQKIRDYTVEFLMDTKQFTENHENEYYNIYLKFLTAKFMGCFGKTTHMKKFEIRYLFYGESIEIRLNKDGYIRFVFSSQLKKNIRWIIGEVITTIFLQNQGNSLFDSMTMIQVLRKQIQGKVNEIFHNDNEIIYIPAGRSLLASMSDILGEISLMNMDLTMLEFINLIRTTRNKFGTKLPEMVKDYTKTVKGQIDNNSIKLANDLIHEILKADYASEFDGEKVYYDEYHWVKLMYASSGQQEVLWILMLAFLVILERKKVFMVIEEPEAHLFPVAQKKVIDLIALMVNSTNSKVIITTHSPYILTSLNILLYSHKVEGILKKKKDCGPVIQKNYRISYKDFAAFRVGNNWKDGNEIEDLMDEESNMIQTEYIDEVSDITNREMGELLDMEFNE